MTTGAARPTMHDVARLAGVSQKTVSNVLNDYAYVRASTRDRVMAAVSELGYTVNVSARTLRTGRNGIICCAVPDLQLEYFAELAAEVIAAAEEHGWRVLVEQTGGMRSRELDVLSSSAGLDGLVFVPTTLSEADGALLTDQFPVVLLNEATLGDAVGTVTMEHYGGARAAVEHLLQGGRTRIASIGAHPDETEGSASERLLGYTTALADAGLTVEPTRVATARLWHRSVGAAAASALLKRDPRIDAIFCFNDALALGALRTLLAAGRRVPDDVALVGFDDIDAASYSTPTLSTVAPGRRNMARAAVAMLADRIAGREHAREASPGFQLVVRESTGW